MITDRHLILIGFISIVLIANSISDYNKRIYLLEEENERITSNLEIMNYALEKGGLLVWKTEDWRWIQINYPKT